MFILNFVWTSTTPRTQREVVWRVPRASGLFSAFGPNRLDRVSIALNLLGVRLIDGRMVFASSGQGSLGQGRLEHPKKYGASRNIVALRIRSEWQRPASDGGSGVGVVLSWLGLGGEERRPAFNVQRDNSGLPGTKSTSDFRSESSLALEGVCLCLL